MKKDQTLIGKTVEYIEQLFGETADGHDAAHSLRVYNNAMNIAEHYENCDQMLVALAALLHDTDDHKLFQTENNANARSFMAKQNIDPDTIDTVCEIINSVSFSKNKDKHPETIEAKIVQDADRLDALGAIGIARTFAYGGKKGRPMGDSIEHFHEKLLLLKDLMNTEEGRKIAEERHDFLVLFLEQLRRETELPRELKENYGQTLQ